MPHPRTCSSAWLYSKSSSRHPAETAEILGLIRELYAIEDRVARGPESDAARRAQRDLASRAVVKRIQDWALATPALTQSGLGRALAYLGGQWKGLVRFVDDPRVPLDNNATERALRGPVVGRKNHYGSKSKRGTEVAALFYSLVESCRLNDVDPKRYLREAAHALLRGEDVALPHELVPSAPT